MKFSNILLPAVVLMSLVQKRSFTANGIPGNFLLKSGFSSNSLAFLSASSKFSVIYEFSLFDF